MDFSGFYVLAKLFCKHGFFKSLLIIAAAFVLIIALLGSEPGVLLFISAMVAVEFVVLFIYYAIQSDKKKKKELEDLKDWVRTTYPGTPEDEVEREAKALLH